MAENELTRSQKLGQARNNAVKRLIESYPDDFKDFMQQESQAVGEEWKPRPTEQEREAAKQAAAREKAQAKLDDLLAKHPELKDSFAPVAAEGQVDQDDDGVHDTV